MLSMELRDRVARMLRMTRQVDDTAPGPTSDLVVGIVSVTISRNELNPGGRFPIAPGKASNTVPPLKRNTHNVPSEKTCPTEQQDIHVVSLA